MKRKLSALFAAVVLAVGLGIYYYPNKSSASPGPNNLVSIRDTEKIFEAAKLLISSHQAFFFPLGANMANILRPSIFGIFSNIPTSARRSANLSNKSCPLS